MRIRKFEGANMREALERVRKDLGAEAMVVSTRNVRRGLLGSGVEVPATATETASHRLPLYLGPRVQRVHLAVDPAVHHDSPLLFRERLRLQVLPEPFP